MRTCTFQDDQRLERCTECGESSTLCKCGDDVDRKATYRITSPTGQTIKAIFEELVRARTKFPSTQYCFPALIEEVGELGKALMEHSRGEPITNLQVFQEAVQVAVMAIRIATEGDPDFLYNPRSILGFYGF